VTAQEVRAAFDAALARAMAAHGTAGAGGAGAGQAEIDAAASVLAAAGEEYGPCAAHTWHRVRRECAARGWEAADLVRMAVRELSARHARLAGVLAEDAGGVGGGADGLARFARDERLDRFSAAAEFVEVLCLYGRLPRIPSLAAKSAAGVAAPVPGQSKVLGRIRALLAKAESTGFPEEAEALTEKAQHLMARHSVDEALLAGPSGGPGARRIGVDRPYEGAKALLLDAVASANRCEAVWAREFGFSTVVGHASDLDVVELLYTSLLVQADRALHRGRSRSRDFRESFLTAYAVRIRERLSAAAEGEVAAAVAGGEDGLLPVLASRDAAVRETRTRLFPATTSARLRGGRDLEGHLRGDEAAARAHLTP
jgi:hypothetical protein